MFGSTAGGSVKRLSTSRLTVVVPTHAAGAVDVRVVVQVGTHTARSAIRTTDRFTFYAPPTVISVLPTTGTDVGGSTVTVTGTGFTALTKVSFGSALGTALTVVSSSKLTVRTPAHPPEAADVRVTGRYGTSPATAHDSYTFAKTSRVFAWGQDDQGQLADNQTAYRPNPTDMTVLSGATAVVIDSYYGGLLLMPDATVRAWGVNYIGSLGTGTTISSAAPVTVPGLSDVVQIASSGGTGYALRADGSVWAWGYDYNGQLGDGTTVTTGCYCRPTAAPVTGLTGVTSIAAGRESAYAVRSDGTVWAWGGNQDGALGDGSGHDSALPVQVPGLGNVTSVTAGVLAAYALHTDGTVSSWGCCGALLGDPGVNYAPRPVQLPGLDSVVAVTVGGGGGFAFRADGTVWAWGDDDLGQLVHGTTKLDHATHIGQLDRFTGIVGAGGTNFGMQDDGTVWAWGDNTYGQLGTGTPTSGGCRCITTPTQLTALNGTTSISTVGLWTLTLKPPE
jgi:alpha-tubulin suppressor-like RCC1 family protein